jgi:3-oxoacyl-[acyl-carrier-protein] synthase II
VTPAAGPAPRVVVTGVGVVSAWGWGVEPFWAGLCSGRTAIRPFSRFDPRRFPTRVAAEVPPPPDGLAARHPGWRRLTASERFAVAAAAEALDACGLGSGVADAGVFFGSSTGGMVEAEEWLERARGAAAGRPRLAALAGFSLSSPGEAVARRFGATGPVDAVSSACASGTLALGQALAALRTGEATVAIAGGADSLCRLTYGGFNALRSVDEAPCRPFRAGRGGLSIGEGAAALVLETLPAALARGARPLVELAGAGASGDAHHMTAPHPAGDGAARAMAAALADAGVAADEVDFVDAHGTGTPLNDAAEWRALTAVFGARAARLPVTTTKGSIGHLLGSAGAAEAVAAALALARGTVPPAPGAGEIDPETPVRLVRGRPLPLPAARVALSLNLAFGGCNAAVVFTRWSAA